MRVLRVPAAPSIDAIPASASGTIVRYDYGEFADPSGAAFSVSFKDGARTDWHSHTGGQFLYVLEGSGLVVTRDGEHSSIGPGDVVVVPPNEQHWHGAFPDTAMTHVALSVGESQREGSVDEVTYLTAVRRTTRRFS
jgi:quercetin dioxygenase-like cupin family protein